MDPISLIVTAVVAGASAGLKGTVAEAISDAYTKMKQLLSKRDIDVTALERRPSSESKQASLREDLEDYEKFPETINESLIAAAREVLAAVKAHDPGTAQAIGIDLKDLDAGGSINVQGVHAEGTGIKGTNWKAKGDVVIRDVKAGGREQQLSDARTEGENHPS